MSKFPHLPLFTDAFIADTGHLSAQETGAYLMLLMVAWRSPGCKLPDDDKKLARWARVDARNWAKVKDAVLEFWTLEEGFWQQKRLSKEAARVHEFAAASRRNGSLGGRPKSLKTNDPANPAGSPDKTQNNLPIPIPIKKEPPTSPKGDGDDVDKGLQEAEWRRLFREEVLPAYPKRKGRSPPAPAEAAYVKARKGGALHEDIIAGIHGYIRQLRGTDRLGSQFVAMMATWLNQQSWKEFQVAAVAKPEPVTISDERWRVEVRDWKVTVGRWRLARHSPPPDHPETKVPAHILAELGVVHHRAAA